MIDDTRIKRCAMLGEPIRSSLLIGASHARSKDPLDRKQAVLYLTPAAELGCAEAQFSLGFLYEKGIGICGDVLRAYRWYYFAAAKGHNEAKIKRDELKKKIFLTQIDKIKRMAEKHSKPCCEFYKKGQFDETDK